MLKTEFTTFEHPRGAYTLKFPAHWEHRVQDEGGTCGFGPRDRDDVGLWITILQITVDSEALGDEFYEMFEKVLQQGKAANIRPDNTLAHRALKADMTDEGQGGNLWMIAGGDLVLFASSTVPPDEREEWGVAFGRLLTTLRITRETELAMHRLAVEVKRRLDEKHPEQEYRFDKWTIRGKSHVVYLQNLFRELQEASEDRRETILSDFVEKIATKSDEVFAYATWDEIREAVLPVLKPREYVRPDGPTKSLTYSEWLDDVIVCYVINGAKSLRFITDWDLNRWEIDRERLHEVAIENLGQLEWPERMEGSRSPGGGRLILVCPNDNFAASRLLHPELHRLMSGPLKSPFLAGVPDRDTLVVFSNRRPLKKRIAQQVKKDYDKSGYPITPRLFLVTPDGIAPAGGLK